MASAKTSFIVYDHVYIHFSRYQRWKWLHLYSCVPLHIHKYSHKKALTIFLWGNALLWKKNLNLRPYKRAFSAIRSFAVNIQWYFVGKLFCEVKVMPFNFIWPKGNHHNSVSTQLSIPWNVPTFLFFFCMYRYYGFND